MADSSWWDRFDLHMKRWQTVIALIVGLSILIGLAVKGSQWYLEHRETSDALHADDERRALTGRYLTIAWTPEISVTGLTPTFEVRLSYKNTTSSTTPDVFAQVHFPPRIEPLRDQIGLINGNNPNEKRLDDTAVTTGANIGRYDPQANAYLYVTMRIKDPETLVCGQTTMTLRGSIRIGDLREYTNELVVRYTRPC